MNIFDDLIEDIQKLRQGKPMQVSGGKPGNDYPPAPENNLILGQDTAMELGNPKDASASFLMWTEKPELVENRRISLLGPDISETQNTRLPFGKVVILQGSGFTEENAYDRHRELELLRYDLSLYGYMMRAVSQYMREWSRISHGALKKGFTLSLLGSAICDLYLPLSYVEKAEVVMITSSREDVEALGQIGEKAMQRIGAMNKMAEELSFDCDACEYQPVCSEAGDLRKMHRKLKGKNA